MINRSVLLYSIIDRGSQHRFQKQTPKALQGCPSPWFGEGEGRMVPSTEQSRFHHAHSQAFSSCHQAMPPHPLLLCIPEMKAGTFQMGLPVPVVSTLHKGKKFLYYKSRPQKGGCSVFLVDENICHYMTFRQPFVFCITCAILGIMSLPRLQVL